MPINAEEDLQVESPRSPMSSLLRENEWVRKRGATATEVASES
jgi:hypothetical protein